jgi:hypothetical protein
LFCAPFGVFFFSVPVFNIFRLVGVLRFWHRPYLAANKKQHPKASTTQFLRYSLRSNINAKKRSALSSAVLGVMVIELGECRDF